jgi:Yip1-like protein
MNYDYLVERVKRLVVQPKQEWAAIDEEVMSKKDIYTRYVMILAAIPPVAGFIGYSVVGVGVFGRTFRVPLATGIAHMIVGYLLALGAVYLLALVINFFAQKFDAPEDFLAALKVAAFAPMPGWVAGVFNVIPALWIIGVLISLYGLYLIFVGLRMLMRPPPEKFPAYFVVVLMAAIFVVAVLRFANDLMLPSQVRGF